MSTYTCRGSGEVGAARQDAVGWCPVCKRIQRARVGTGKLVVHTSPYKAHSRKPVDLMDPRVREKVERWRRQ